MLLPVRRKGRSLVKYSTLFVSVRKRRSPFLCSFRCSLRTGWCESRVAGDAAIAVIESSDASPSSIRIAFCLQHGQRGIGMHAASSSSTASALFCPLSCTSTVPLAVLSVKLFQAAVSSFLNATDRSLLLLGGDRDAIEWLFMIGVCPMSML